MSIGVQTCLKQRVGLGVRVGVARLVHRHRRVHEQLAHRLLLARPDGQVVELARARQDLQQTLQENASRNVVSS